MSTSVILNGDWVICNFPSFNVNYRSIRQIYKHRFYERQTWMILLSSVGNFAKHFSVQLLFLHSTWDFVKFIYLIPFSGYQFYRPLFSFTELFCLKNCWHFLSKWYCKFHSKNGWRIFRIHYELFWKVGRRLILGFSISTLKPNDMVHVLSQ